MGVQSAMRDVSPRRIRSDLYCDSAMDRRNGAAGSSHRKSPSILAVLSSLLERVVIRNERRKFSTDTDGPPKKLAIFYGNHAPSISIEQYLVRIFEYADCSASCFVVAYAYIDRMMQMQPELRILSLNVHRLLITSVMVAAKFLDDIYYDNAYYAKIGGTTVQEINKLEKEFLFLLDFRLQVTVSVFDSYCSHLEREVALGGGYQIERTLRSICALDRGSSEQKSTEKQRALSLKCYAGS